MIALIVIAVVVVLILAFLIGVYNELVKGRVMVEEGWSSIGTFLQQRNDVIPNLVEVVKGYAKHEQGTLTEVVKWRNQSAAATTPQAQSEASAGLQKALVNVMAVAEQYPDLKANANFLQLQHDLKDLEEKINQARRYYNGTVREFNMDIAVFPKNLVAGMFGIKNAQFFAEDEGAKVVPTVKF
jgi:LemA protein